MFRCHVSLWHHHALEVAGSMGMPVHGHAALAWGVRQVLGPLQGLHQVRVWMLRGEMYIGALGPGCVWSTRHCVGRRASTLLHAPGIVGEVVLGLGRGAAASCSVVAIQIQQLFRAFGAVRALLHVGMLCWAASILTLS